MVHDGTVCHDFLLHLFLLEPLLFFARTSFRLCCKLSTLVAPPMIVCYIKILAGSILDFCWNQPLILLHRQDFLLHQIFWLEALLIFVVSNI